ncbi:MAG: hypothetical protein KF805_05555 [Phycisphaeraceae bacterium]|nr:hypothetical protein [Phycisphaeraceae bacterium]
MSESSLSCASTGPKRIALDGRAPSRRLLRACCRFGIGVSRGASARPSPRDLDVLLGLAPGGFALVTGASGSGKSRLLRSLREKLREAGGGGGKRGGGDGGVRLRDLGSIYRPDRGIASVIDLIPLPLDRALRLLGAAGLADPFVLGRTVRELSVGERARFTLARSLALQMKGPGWLLIDEFLTTLDRETAFAVARSFRHAARELAPELRVIVATAHADVEAHLGADVCVRM